VGFPDDSMEQLNHHVVLLSTAHDPPARNVSLINLNTDDLKKKKPKTKTTFLPTAEYDYKHLLFLSMKICQQDCCYTETTPRS
jgi:hypothetical protein